MMTRKHFNAIADVVAEAEMFTGIQDAETIRKRIASRLADVCYNENPNFDRERFLKACEV